MRSGRDWGVGPGMGNGGREGGFLPESVMPKTPGKRNLQVRLSAGDYRKSTPSKGSRNQMSFMGALAR